MIMHQGANNRVIKMSKKRNRQDDIFEAYEKTPKPAEGANAYRRMFEAGASWADRFPYWKTNTPKPRYDTRTNLPVLYLCKCLSLDMTHGYRYTYRIGFITRNEQWNINEAAGMLRVVAYMDIISDESETALIADIERNEQYFVDKAVGEIAKQKEGTDKK